MHIYLYICTLKYKYQPNTSFMLKLKSMALAAAMSVGATMWAVEEDSLYFTFRHADGNVTQIEIPFPDETAVELPTMKFTETSVVITIPSETPGEAPAIHSIAVEDLKNSTFDAVTSIRNVIVENSTVFSPLGGNRIGITSPETINEGDVCVYDLTGKQVSCPITVSESSAIVSLEGQTESIYIISYKNNNIKVTKK